MKPPQHTISTQAGPGLRQISGWYQRLAELHARLRPHFARPEVHQHALGYLHAVLSDVPRKNGWQIAEQAREAHPYGIERLLSRAIWNQEAVRDDLRALVRQTLLPLGAEQAAPFPVLVVDESGFPKRGRHSAGVSPQYCGLTGRVENCQVGVFLSYVTASGHALIDRELYLPQDWCADPARRLAAHIPDDVRFATKPELGQRMIGRAKSAGLPFGWVVADTVYGHSPELRAFLEEQGLAYALAVPSTEVVCVQTRTGLLLSDVASIARQALRSRDWQRLSSGQGTKGERFFDWARLPMAQAGVADGRQWLLIRRCLDDPHELAYYLVWAPADTPLTTMVQAIGSRWHIEEDLEASKALGLDHYEVRSAPSLVSASHPGPTGLRLPGQPHRAEPPHGCGLGGGGSRPGPPAVDHRRSPPPAGAPLLAGAHLRALDRSLVALSAHPPILGRLLSSAPPRQSRLSLPLEPPGLLLGIFPGVFPGKLPGVRQAGSSAGFTSHSKGGPR